MDDLKTPTPPEPEAPATATKKQVTDSTPINLHLTVWELNQLMSAWDSQNKRLAQKIQTQADASIQAWQVS